MRRIAAASLALGLWLTLGVAAPRTAPASVSFATTKGIVTGPGAASVLLDTGKGTFTRIKRQPNGMPRIATADASGDLNGDGKPDLVTHLNTSEDGEGITIDGVTIYPAYA